MTLPFCIIVPYRDRESHLAVFAQYYKGLFADVDIFVIEQLNGEFNRGKLLNIGFLEFGKQYDYCAYHDVDMLAIPGKFDYSYPDVPTHIATNCSQFGYRMPYPKYIGGVLLINSEDMIKSNGYSNEMWGWGVEDDEFRKNLILKQIPIINRESWFECLSHPRKNDPTLYYKNLGICNSGRQPEDGLTHCKYIVVSTDKNILHTKIKVNL